jgi:hypothetical protein
MRPTLASLFHVLAGTRSSPTAGVPGRPAREMPSRLRVYIASVTLAYIAFQVMLLTGAWPEMTAHALGAAASLALLIALARAFPVRLTPKRKTIVDTAPAFAAVILLAPALAAIAGAVGMAAGEIRVRGRWFQVCFNASVSGLRIGAATLICRHLAGADAATAGKIPLRLPALLVATAVLYLVSALLVDIAAGLTLGQNPFQGWWAVQRRRLPHESVLLLIGVFGALPARDNPWLLPLLIVPAAIVRRSLQDSVPMKSETREALESLAEAVDLRHLRSADHSRRVAELARVIARRMDLSARDIGLVVDASRLRDVGEVALPPDLLASPARLTREQRDQLRSHTVIGADMVSRFADFAGCAPLILHHHDRWDGDGSADGLAGEQIPLGARIIAVAETYEALIAHRPYRDALSPEQARAELRRSAGTQLDPTIVEILLDLLGDRAASGASALVNRLASPSMPHGGGM